MRQNSFNSLNQTVKIDVRNSFSIFAKYFTRMYTYDLAIAYKWKYDKEFVELIDNSFHRNGLKHGHGKFNLFEVIDLTKKNKISFKLCDRASDEDLEFIPLTKLLAEEVLLNKSS